MSVLAIGLDVVDVVAFARQLDDVASGFVTATFTPGERRAAGGDRDERARHLAVRFAAKEALVKAWSGARSGQPPSLSTVDLSTIEVVQDPWGRPRLVLHEPVAAEVAALGGGDPVHVHLSLSHDGPMAAAVVVLDAGA